MQLEASPTSAAGGPQSRVATERVWVGPRRRKLALSRALALLAFTAMSAYVVANLYWYSLR